MRDLRADASRCAAAGSPQACAAGWLVIFPGLAQRSWGQYSRATVLWLSWISAIFSAVFTWGTLLGVVLLAFAFGVHLFATVDAWQQQAFPKLGPWAGWLTATGWLAGGLYAPLLTVAFWLAWPGLCHGEMVEGYLVDRAAYRQESPRSGDWVWFRPSASEGPRLGRVLAGSGQKVLWEDNLLRVDGKPVRAGVPFRSDRRPHILRYQIPPAHVLLSSEGSARGRGNMIVAHNAIMGRAWAQYYPILDRRLLD